MACFFLTLVLFYFLLVDSFLIIVIFPLLFVLDQEKGQVSLSDGHLHCIWLTIPWCACMSLSWQVPLQLSEVCRSHLKFRVPGST